MDECAIHGPEPIPPGCYLMCPECWHAYPTPEALLHEHNLLLALVHLPPETDPEQVAVCPHCTHDL